MIVHACTSSHSSGGEAIQNQQPEDIHELVTSTDFVWHQRFELENGVYTPGAHDIEWLMDAAGVPRDLARRAVLDVEPRTAEPPSSRSAEALPGWWRLTSIRRIGLVSTG
jgi:hypothetical protein